MAEEATAPATPAETPPAPVETTTPAQPANDTTDPSKPANDNAQTQAPTEAEVVALVDRFGAEKALQIIAKKAGFVVDQGAVTVEDRAKFRAANREAKQALQERERAIEAALGNRVKESEAEIEFGRAIKAAFQQGDYDGVARGLGKKDWNELQDDFIAKLADPSHKRLTELERKLQEKEQAETKQREQWEAQERQRQQATMIEQYKAGTIAPGMKQSQSPILRELADNPDVVNMLYAIQNEHFDRSTGSTITLEQALMLPLPGQKTPLRELLRGWSEQLGRAFKPDAPAAPPVAPKAKGATAPAPGVKPSPTRDFKDTSEWTKNAAERLKLAFDQDTQREAEERRKVNSHSPT